MLIYQEKRLKECTCRTLMEGIIIVCKLHFSLVMGAKMDAELYTTPETWEGLRRFHRTN